jgi:5-hydroxyisourate hydrolase-like protein (transthyretin family)
MNSMRRFTRAALFTWALAFAVVACGSDSSTDPDPAQPTTLSIVSGDGQTLDAGETSAALTVQVVDQNSSPMAGVTVTFTGSGVEHTLSGQSASTGSNGQASVTVTAGATEGAIQVEAAVSGLQPVTFALQVETGLTATTLTIVSGDGQTLDFDEASEALVVEVLDQNDEPIEGVTVTFAGSGADHSLSAGTAETGADGRAQVTVTAGTVEGTIEVEAAVEGLDPVVFTLTVEEVQVPSTLAIVSGDGQTLDFNEASEALVVEVLDQNDEPIEGVTVTFTGSGADHSLSAGTAETGGDGRAQVTVTAGTEEGTIEVEAAVEGLDAVVFTLTVEEVLAPTTLAIVSGDGQTLDFNEVSDALVVEVLDQNNDPVEGVTVSFEGSGVAHELSDGSVETGADGRAQITVTAGVVDGAIEVEASVAGLTPVVFGLVVADGPFSLTAPDNVRGVTFDGTWLWAVGGPDVDPVIFRLDPTDGSVQQSFSAPAADHRGLAWGDNSLWYSSDDTGNIYQIDPSNGSVLNSFASPGLHPRGLTWVGTSLWHNARTGGVGTGTVYRLFPENGTVLGQVASPVGDPLGLTWDGTHFWTAQFTAAEEDRTLVRFDDTGAVDTQLPNPGTLQIGLAFDSAGPWLWSSDPAEGVIHRIKLDP